MGLYSMGPCRYLIQVIPSMESGSIFGFEHCGVLTVDGKHTALSSRRVRDIDYLKPN